LSPQSSGDAEEIATWLAGATVDAVGAVPAEDTGDGAASARAAGIGAASSDPSSGRAAAAGAGGPPASSEIDGLMAPACGGCAGLCETAIDLVAGDLLAGTASSKNPAPNDPLMIRATKPTSARYSRVPTGIPPSATAQPL
jgi:hypothetical protein